MPAPRRAVQPEPERLQALYHYQVLDSPPEPSFDRLTALAARLFDAPIALVSLVEQERQWFKSAHGLCERQTSTSVSFCKHTLSSDSVLVVPDAAVDPRFADNGLVTGAPHIRFYAGAPLITPDGYNLGSLCIIDHSPRVGLSEADRRTLQDLADIAVDELELRRAYQEAETGLRQQAERVTQAVELSQDAISLLDANNRFVFVNRACEMLYGYPGDELLGQPIDLIYDAEGRQRMKEEVLPVLRNNGAWHGTCNARHRTGALIEQEVSLAALPDGGMVRVARDVTARNAAQRTRRRLRAELHQAQKLESVGRLAGGIAHDFNNVLAAIAGYAGFLVDDLASDSAEAAYARQIATAAERGKTLVQQILSFSRRDSLAMTVIDISEVVSETAGLLTAAMPRELRLDCELPETLLRVRGNESALGRAVMNLATNARDALAGSDTPPRPDRGRPARGPAGRCRHRSERIDRAGRRRIGPVDRSAGRTARAADRPARAPGRHHRGVGGRRRRRDRPGQAGTGAGALLHQQEGRSGHRPRPLGRVRHRAQPWRRSDDHDRPGPRYRGHNTSGRAARAAAGRRRGAGARDTRMRTADGTADATAGADAGGTRRLVLIVDDEQTVAQVTADSVSRLGHAALTTTSARQALDLVRARHGEIAHLVTDLNMPEMTGSDLADAVKRIDPQIAVTLISGRTPVAAERALSSIDHVLEKPVARAELARVLRPQAGNGDAR